LTRQLLEHLCGTGKSVTRFADGDVEDELLDAQFPHGVGGLVLGFGLSLTISLMLLMSRETSVADAHTIVKDVMASCWG